MTEIQTNVADYLLADKQPGQLALWVGDTQYTYGQLQGAVAAIAENISQNAGGMKGDRVILISDNSFFWVAAYLGVLRAGLVCVPLPGSIPEVELRHIIETTEARLGFIQARLARKLTSNTSPVLWVDDEETMALVDEAAHTSTDGERVKSGIGGDALPAIGVEDLAALMFTSGSTGKPRGVMISHGNIIANTGSIIEYLGLSSDDRIMDVLPFHYCFGTSLLHTHLRVGGSLVLESRFMYPEVILQRMQATECTGFAGVPSHYQILLRSSSIRKKTFPRLRYVQQAGGALAKAFIHELRQALPGIQIFIMYGQTEATARLSCLPPEYVEEKLGSIGKGIPGVSLRVVDDSGREVGAGEVGEIVAEGGNIAQGYWHSAEESSAAFRGGRLYTGDLATVDEDGFIYIVDRAKDVVKCGGKRVSCRQIEEELLASDLLVEAAVIGVPDDVLGEAVKAFVVPRVRGAADIAEQLRLLCKGRLAPQLMPREIVVLPSLPKNDGGKVLKQSLKRL